MEKIVLKVSTVAIGAFVAFAVIGLCGFHKIGTFGMLASLGVIVIASGAMCIRIYIEATKEAYSKEDEKKDVSQ